MYVYSIFFLQFMMMSVDESDGVSVNESVSVSESRRRRKYGSAVSYTHLDVYKRQKPRSV